VICGVLPLYQCTFTSEYFLTQNTTNSQNAMKGGDVMGIIVDPNVLHGQPHIKGTRVRVADVLGELICVEVVQRQYPQLTDTEICEAINFAIRAVENWKDGDT
jgi:uncharacterized protein (DUF433 family)